jgi:SMP-30/Gluconolactonase/LRE-like region
MKHQFIATKPRRTRRFTSNFLYRIASWTFVIFVSSWLLARAVVITTTIEAQAPAGCAPSGGLSFICGIQNAEDLVPVPNSHWMFASGMADGSGLHLIDTSAKRASTLYGGGKGTARADRARFPNCPAPLDSKLAHLHGLSLRPAQAAHYTLYATNHGGRESIEVFDVDAGAASPSATWIGCVPMPDKLPANSVAVFKDGTILATVLITPDKTFEDAFAGRITGVVYQWTPGAPGFKKLPGTELSANNGIETSADDRTFYVASTTTKRVLEFSRADPSKPMRAAQLKEFGPDNIRLIGGRLVTAGMIDNEPACGGAPKTADGIRCSRGYIADAIDPKTLAVTEIARGPATPAFTGTATAIPVGNELWLGSFNADRVAYRSLK